MQLFRIVSSPKIQVIEYTTTTFCFKGAYSFNRLRHYQHDVFDLTPLGFITNTMFDTPKAVEYNFNSALPPNHYSLKRKQELKDLPLEQQVTLRVDDLHKDIRCAHFYSNRICILVLLLIIIIIIVGITARNN